MFGSNYISFLMVQQISSHAAMNRSPHNEIPLANGRPRTLHKIATEFHR